MTNPTAAQRVIELERTVGEYAARFTTIEDTLAGHTTQFNRIETLLQQLAENQQRQPPPPPPPLLPLPNVRVPQPMLPRFDFPPFSGTDPAAWVRKCVKLFQLHTIPDGQRVEYASLYLEGRADVWFQGWSSGKQELLWDEFNLELVRRFGDLSYNNVIGSFNKLKQGSSVVEYQEKFEDLRSRMLNLNPELTEPYFVNSFISGLDEEIQPVLLMLDPPTLTTAFLQARMEELSIEARKKKFRTSTRWQADPGGGSHGKKPPLPPSKPVSNLPPVGRGLCYKCGDRYHFGHVCARKSLQVMHGEEHENTSEEEPEPGEEEVTVEPEATSFLAMGGNPQGSAIKLKGRLGRMALIILIDTGSSHTFLSDKSAQTLNCTLLTAPPMRRQKFTFDVRIIPLKENDLVLGFDWLRTVSPVSMDFENLQMTFQWDGKPLTLIGMEETSSCQWLSGKEFGKYVTKGHFWGLAGHLCEAVMEQQPASVPAFLKEILVQFRDVFLTPTTLPHSRPCDHAIPLTEGAKPVNLRPYRYPPAQKDEIERLVEEMMAAGVIQTSHSPFASPVLLVKKKDGTWRFCVDYRQLNSVTIKDKFPIPMIDDLLDELAGSCFFTKLDLRAGYHQIRMRPEDQHKTAFRTHHGHFEFRVMPFGLTNAPATFQALMNQVLAPYLRKFVLVFFDDILIYSSTEEAHKDHLYKTLQLLREHKLLAKKSKCSFGQQKIEYLGHIVTSEGVATDSKKIAAMIQWPYPKTIKALRGFLGLTGYYRKFIRNYAIISKPLTELLKKNQFQWSETAAIAFDELKQAMTTAPVLALPDFTKAFTLETDASGIGIGAVLSQQGRPIAYLSQVLSLRNQSLSTYEKEYLAVIFAVGRWRHYLEGHPFTILTDHESLKYLLGQKIHTHIQKKGLIKLLGLDFEIRYRQGKFNRVADALSRVFEDPLQPSQCSNITAVLPEWLTEVERSYDNDDEVQALIIAAAVAPGGPSMYCYSQGLLKYKGMVYVGGSGEMRKQLMNLFHSSPTGGHSGGQATYQRMKKFFYWPGMKRDITQWVAACQTCQQCKAETTPYPGLLQPLPIPDRAWQHISMDFIEGLPKSDGKEVIWVVVDRLTKYSHFIAVSHPYTAVTIAQLFMDHIFKLHGMPTTIVSDRDVIFTSNFWKEMFRLQGTNLHYSTAYHPQTDGQTERLNRCLEDYLRCMVMGKAQAWHQWLALAEWWYNTNYHNSLKITPFEALYGYPPSMFSLQNPLSTSVAAVADRMRQQHQLVDMMRQNLAKAQNRQKQYADKHRSERAFAVGDWVYLRLHPYKQSTIAARVNQKLAPRFYGPFLILEKKGAVAYKLKLPDTAAIHPVFHVSLLKKMVGVGGVVQATLPDVDATGVLKLEPVAILARQFIKRNNIAVTQVLVQWSHQTEADAVWEDWETFKQAYPDFQQS